MEFNRTSKSTRQRPKIWRALRAILTNVRTPAELDEFGINLRDCIYIMIKTNIKKDSSKPTVKIEPEIQPNQPITGKRLQYMYDKDSRRTIQHVFVQSAVPNRVSKKEIYEHYSAKFQEQAPPTIMAPWADENPPISAEIYDILTEPITNFEVKSRLQRSNTTPGPDNITFFDLLKLDPQCELLATLYNTCIRLQHVPKIWKHSNTILVRENGDPEDPLKWKPVALLNSVLKIFSGLISDRITNFLINSQILTKRPKCLVNQDESPEHNFVVQEILCHSQRTGNEVAIARINMINAFDSLSFDMIYEILSNTGLPKAWCNLVCNMNKGCYTRIRTENSLTEQFPITCGLRHGSPGRSVVFHVVINHIIRKLERLNVGYRLSGTLWNVLTYSDNMCLIGASAHQLRALLHTLGMEMAEIGMKFSPKKSVTYHLRVTSDERVEQGRTHFRLQSEALPVLLGEDAQKYLGAAVVHYMGYISSSICQQIIAEVHELDNTSLLSSQKLDAVRRHILPKLDSALRLGHLDHDLLEKADGELTIFYKKWMVLPVNCPYEVFYTNKSNGGASLLPLVDLADIQTVLHAFRMLTSDNSHVQRLAWGTLEESVEATTKHRPTTTMILHYLSGIHPITASDMPASLWTRTRNATARLSQTIGLEWSLSSHQKISLSVERRAGCPITLMAHNRQVAVKMLKQAQNNFYLSILLKQVPRNCGYEVAVSSDVSNSYLYGTQFISQLDWNFIHRGRLGLLHVNSARECRRCKVKRETLEHTLCWCSKQNYNWNGPLGYILSYISRAVKAPGRILLPNECPKYLPNLGAYISVWNKSKRTVIIVDVALSYGGCYQSFVAARADSSMKYSELATRINELGYCVYHHTIVLGILGVWDNANNHSMSLLRIPYSQAMKIKLQVLTIVVKRARQIYNRHMQTPRSVKSKRTNSICDVGK